MKLIIASNNRHKIEEIRAMLGARFECVQGQREAGLELDVDENADTLEGNARKKAEEVFAAADARGLLCPGDAVLADDSGLLVDALGGAPGVHSARYATDGHDDAANRAKLLREMDGVKDGERGAHFATAMVLLRKGRPDIEATGRVYGEIGRAELGENGFGYDSLFYYPPFKKTFAQLEPDEKNSVSHRKNALSLVLAALESEGER
ncbi:MAG: RdgB/HAM1 family non-canonical purine NTP pyrophosphatase [Clostridia bacterium]|nr:RdgB/HAM1 family non-canonical purine NTP pyrophosphatase [Clostridia bacterium]MBQ2517728.1 RdgB/HAM1 family non-canonical purine NTP pyrophosphatase [Clostridia bacterium]MBQ4341952.1 RdgB/HAM1 family non-canonical purine NTP pyrophosphatase [Clostridia bacterium]